jgi:hypothetical protein
MSLKNFIDWYDAKTNRYEKEANFFYLFHMIMWFILTLSSGLILLGGMIVTVYYLRGWVLLLPIVGSLCFVLYQIYDFKKGNK